MAANTTTTPKLSAQELFDQVIAKIKQNLDQDVADKTKTEYQAEFILREQTTYLKIYLKL